MQLEKKAKAGTERFGDLINSNGYYVDKTGFLRELLTNTDDVVLFTRPRRFGKTLTMSMIEEFLKLDAEEPGRTERQQRLFKGLDVMKDHELCDKFMGQFPVISITLKRVTGTTIEGAMKKFAGVVSDMAHWFAFLLHSPKLGADDKKKLSTLLDHDKLLEDPSYDAITSSIPRLAACLYQHFGRQVIVLIDEYDVPLAKAQMNGYHKSMSPFYGSFFDFLKADNWGVDGNLFFKTIMTGCLRVAKNHIFTGSNNFTPNTVLSPQKRFSSFFGFTPSEADAYLEAFGLSKYKKFVKRMYDGYRFGTDEIYNPWDVGKFVADAMEAEKDGVKIGGNLDYWTGSESTNTTAIKEYVKVLSEKDNQKLQDLSDGKEVEVVINDSMDYDCLDKHNATDMWSLLLHTGYVTAVREIKKDLKNAGSKYVVRIPNAEIKKCFDDSIIASFMEVASKDNANLEILEALAAGNALKAQELLQRLLGSYVSVRAFATKAPPENFYEGFVLGVLASLGDRLQDVMVESAAGSGYADIKFRYSGRSGAMVFELKVAGSVSGLATAVQNGLKQIEEKHYAGEFVADPSISKVTAVGIAFLKKSCVVATKALKGSGKATAK